jgi:uncharacterized protein YkwD
MRRLLVACLTTVLVAGLTPATATLDDPVGEVVSLVNHARERHGLAPLVVSPALAASAARYAQMMARLNFFGHLGPDGSSLDTRDEAAGYVDWLFLAENLAGGQPTAQEAVAAWIASPSHDAELLSPLAHDTGVGFALAPGSKYVDYWVQEFGARSAPAAPSPLPPAVTSVFTPASLSDR